ncbi:hypothetical protein [Rickettsia endosymbiont of Rhinocyllus conicus]
MLKRRTASAGFFSQIWDNKKYIFNSLAHSYIVISQYINNFTWYEFSRV